MYKRSRNLMYQALYSNTKNLMVIINFFIYFQNKIHDIGHLSTAVSRPIICVSLTLIFGKDEMNIEFKVSGYAFCHFNHIFFSNAGRLLTPLKTIQDVQLFLFLNNKYCHGSCVPLCNYKYLKQDVIFLFGINLPWQYKCVCVCVALGQI